MVKKEWNSIPWNEAEYSMAILQNSLYKSSKRKDSFHKFKLQNKIGQDPRSKLLTLRKIVDQDGFFFKQNFSKKKVENDSNLELIIFDFLKLKKLSSLQKFKLASMFSSFFLEKELKLKLKNLETQVSKSSSSFSPEQFFMSWDSVFPEQEKSFNRLFLNKKFQQKELFSLFERIFEIFPTKKSLQAFQFCCFLQLSNEELSKFIFEAELEPLLEPNLQPSSLYSNEIKTLVYEKKGKKCFPFLRKGFHTLLSNAFLVKNTFLFSGFLSDSSCSFFIKVFSHFIKNLTLHGFTRIKGFFGDFYGWVNKNISKTNYQEKILSEPFLFSGLEFDIKKWHKTDKEKKKKIFNFHFEKNQEIDKSTDWLSNFFFLLQKTRFLFFSTRINSLFNFSFERFITDWFSTSLKKIFIKSFNSSTLEKGIEFQNHVIRAYPKFFLRKKSSSFPVSEASQGLLESSFLKKRKKLKPHSMIKFAKGSQTCASKKQGLFLFSSLGTKGTNLSSVKEECRYRRKGGTTKKKLYKIQIFPCKNYQQRLVRALQEIISQNRGNSAKSIIFALGSLLNSWNSSLSSIENISNIHKIVRRIDSIVHLQLLKWVYKCHPNWNRKKSIEKYFPRQKIFVFQGFPHKENWIFSDSFQDKNIFLLRLSWFHLNKGKQKRESFNKKIYSGVF
jgi:hypothetical protein